MSNVIKALRLLRGYSQQDISIKLGINLRTYIRREKNPGSFTISEIQKLSEILEVDEMVFFKNKLTVDVS